MRPTSAINLASAPFRKDRPVLVSSIAVSVLLVLTLAMQIFLVTAQSGEGADAEARVEAARDELGKLAAEEARLRAILAEPDNEAAIERSLFLNTLLMRKGISWTLIFRDLEEVVPYNVKLVQIRPQVNMRNPETMEHEVLLDMVVAAESIDPVLDLLRALAGSKMFGAPTAASQQPPTENDPVFRYQISVRYNREI